ncbi:MAG: HlyD family efflux transporter periplasmic adaptor subunit, partial [Myxococcota bacterium]
MSEASKPTVGQLIVRAIIALGILGVGIMIFGALVSTRPEPSKKPRVDSGLLVEVVAAEAKSSEVIVPANGQIIPAQQIALSAEVSGRVTWLSDALIPGGHIKAGDQIARIDARDYTLAVEQQVAQVDQANTELEVERNRKVIAEREWELLGGNEPANAVALRDPQLRTARASLKSAESALRRAKLNVSKSVIRAPFNALVQQKSVDIGQLVGPQSPLATLVGSDVYWVQAALSVDQLKRIRIPGVSGATEGSAVTVRKSLGDREVTRQGKVIQLLPDLDPVGRMARVLVEIR